METAPIFEPYSLNGMKLQNRVVMAPMTRSRSANRGNVATALTALYYKQRAGAGLIVTEGTFISKEAVGVVNVPGIYTREQVEGWKLTTMRCMERAEKYLPSFGIPAHIPIPICRMVNDHWHRQM